MAGKMIEVEGFKAFRGSMRIIADRGNSAFVIHGEWLYKPETNCWYCNGNSYFAPYCEVLEVY